MTPSLVPFSPLRKLTTWNFLSGRTILFRRFDQPLRLRLSKEEAPPRRKKEVKRRRGRGENLGICEQNWILSSISSGFPGKSCENVTAEGNWKLNPASLVLKSVERKRKEKLFVEHSCIFLCYRTKTIARSVDYQTRSTRDLSKQSLSGIPNRKAFTPCHSFHFG